jgi:hypothetical protein
MHDPLQTILAFNNVSAAKDLHCGVRVTDDRAGVLAYTIATETIPTSNGTVMSAPWMRPPLVSMLLSPAVVCVFH